MHKIRLSPRNYINQAHEIPVLDQSFDLNPNSLTTMDDAGHRQHCDEHDAWEPEGDGVVALPPEITRAGRRNHQLKPAHPSPSPPPSKCAKKSRRSAQKRVVSVAVGDGEGFRGKSGGAGEAFPPSDSWQWRKYGQKPIKGSPYPRGYYRCSSCKGCPARKQVERSRNDPNMLVVAYSFEHNHPWPLPKNARRQPPAAAVAVAEELVDPPQPPLEPASVVKEEKHYADEDIAEEEKPLLTADDGSFRWFFDMASPCSTSAGSDELLYGSDLFGGADAAAGSAQGEDREAETMAMETAAAEADEDSLFAGLGELPEYSVVLRRGLAAASWIGTDG